MAHGVYTLYRYVNGPVVAGDASFSTVSFSQLPRLTQPHQSPHWSMDKRDQ